MQRVMSWIECAEKADNDDARFIFYWIAFNAAYQPVVKVSAAFEQRCIPPDGVVRRLRMPNMRPPHALSGERLAALGATRDSTTGCYGRRGRRKPGVKEHYVFAAYFGKILDLDTDNAIHHAIWKWFPGLVKNFLDNQYVFRPFWEHHNDDGPDDWAEQFECSRAALGRDTRTILIELFDRLYVLRNQIMHGGATWKGSVNRSQVRDGARIMAFLVPRFASLMMSNPGIDWGPPRYLVAD